MKANYTRAICLFLVMTSALLMQSCKKHDYRPVKAVTLELVADNLVSPLGVVASPDNTKRLFIIDQVGKIWIVDKDGNKLSTPFMDVSSMMVTLNTRYDERGLLGF